MRQGPPLRITAVETIHTRYPLSRPTGPAGGTDMALHDLRGKALGVPVHRLYGGALRQRVPVYASGLCYFPDIDPASCWVEEACALVERGFVSGIKDSSGDLAGFRDTVIATQHLPDFRAFTGSEQYVDAAMLVGGHGGVLGLASVIPRV